MNGKKVGMFAALMLSGALAMPVLAQTDPNAGAGGAAPAGQGQGQGGGRQRGGGGAGGAAQFQQRMMDNLKTQMGATDDEFAAIQPKIEKVMQLQRDANAGGRGMMGGGRQRGGGQGGGGGATPAAGTQQSAVAKARADLQTTLDNKDATADDIKGKLQALRDAQTQAKTDLEAAQKDLASVLTQRQEAVLVMAGMLS